MSYLASKLLDLYLLSVFSELLDLHPHYFTFVPGNVVLSSYFPLHIYSLYCLQYSTIVTEFHPHYTISPRPHLCYDQTYQHTLVFRSRKLLFYKIKNKFKSKEDIKTVSKFFGK